MSWIGSKRDAHRPDKLFQASLRLVGLAVLCLLGVLTWELWKGSSEALSHFGWKFFITNQWNPVKDEYGAAATIVGTLITSAIALIVAVPLAVGSALWLNELAPRGLGRVVGFLIEMLAAIPSVVFGLWGLFVLVPWVRIYLQPALQDSLGFLPIFSGAPFGIGILSAGLILAVMIIPTIASVSREIFRSIPNLLREGALALGATRWESIREGVLKTGLPGVLAASILGLGRALGETMAVAMVIGNRPEVPTSLMDGGATMASLIANEYAEAVSDLHQSSLRAIGLGLLGVSLLVNAIAKTIVWRLTRKQNS
jgi:phosphate transport system permease protein